MRYRLKAKKLVAKPTLMGPHHVGNLKRCCLGEVSSHVARDVSYQCSIRKSSGSAFLVASSPNT